MSFLDDTNLLRRSLQASTGFYDSHNPRRYYDAMRVHYPSSRLIASHLLSEVNRGGTILRMDDCLLVHLLGVGGGNTVPNLIDGWATANPMRFASRFNAGALRSALTWMRLIAHAKAAYPTLPVVVLGHSGGGTVARCLTFCTVLDDAVPLDYVITFGEPMSMVGPFLYALPTMPNVRCVNNGDGIVSLPVSVVNLPSVRVGFSQEQRERMSHFAHYSRAILFQADNPDGQEDAESRNRFVISESTILEWGVLGRGTMNTAHSAAGYAATAGRNSIRDLLDIPPDVARPTFARGSHSDQKLQDLERLSRGEPLPVPIIVNVPPPVPLEETQYLILPVVYPVDKSTDDPLDDSFSSLPGSGLQRPVNNPGVPEMFIPNGKIAPNFRPHVVRVGPETHALIWLDKTIAQGTQSACRLAMRRLLSLLRVQTKLVAIGAEDYLAAYAEFMTAAFDSGSGAVKPPYNVAS